MRVARGLVWCLGLMFFQFHISITRYNAPFVPPGSHVPLVAAPALALKHAKCYYMSSTEVERQLRGGLWCLGASSGHSRLLQQRNCKLDGLVQKKYRLVGMMSRVP